MPVWLQIYHSRIFCSLVYYSNLESSLFQFIKVHGLEKCPLDSTTSKEDCRSAGLSAGGELQDDDSLDEWAWSDKPSGCFLSEDNIISYNTKPIGTTSNDNDTLICEKIEVRIDVTFLLLLSLLVTQNGNVPFSCYSSFHPFFIFPDGGK